MIDTPVTPDDPADNPTASVRRVRADADGRMTVHRVDVPVPAPGEALVELETVGICGSDLHAVAGTHPFLQTPYLPGHEVVGRVCASTSNALPIGARVVVEPTLSCGKCKMCLTGRENVCADRGFFGCGHSQGGMADYMTIRDDRLHVVPESLPIAAAALIEPIATPLHAITLSGGVEGKAVVVLGAGTIGLLTVIACRARGARTIAVTDLSDTKLELARRLGAHHAVSATTPDYLRQVRSHLGESADVVFDCVAAPSTIAAAITLVERGGTVTIVGVPSTPAPIDLPAIQEHQITLQGAATYAGADFAAAIAVVEQHPDQFEPLISGVLELAQANEALALAREESTIKVLLTRGNLVSVAGG